MQEGETGLAYAAMVELRPELGPPEAFVRQVDERQRPEGYRLAAAFDDDDDDDGGGGSVASVAGFRTGHSLSRGRYLFVDDLVTRSDRRGLGHGKALLDWLRREADHLGCDEVHLDSGTQRHGAHRFYLREGFAISSFHFCVPVASS